MVAGASTTAALLSLLQIPLLRVEPALKAGIAAALLVVTFSLFARNLLPERRELVPQAVISSRSMSGWRRFGFELGLGWRTRITTFAPYATALSILIVGNAVEALGAGIAFGMARTRSLSADVRLLYVPSPHLTARLSVAATVFAVGLSVAT